MLEILIFVIILVMVTIACIYDDPNSNHKHDFDGPDAMPLIVDGVLMAWCCANPRCTVIRLEEKTYAEED
jgi:hypothetical protein